MHRIPPIGSASVGGMRQFRFQITITDVILVVYFIKVQLRTINRIMKYINSEITGVMGPRVIIMLKRKCLLIIRLQRTITIFLLGKCNGRFGDLGDAL